MSPPFTQRLPRHGHSVSTPISASILWASLSAPVTRGTSDPKVMQIIRCASDKRGAELALESARAQPVTAAEIASTAVILIASASAATGGGGGEKLPRLW